LLGKLHEIEKDLNEVLIYSRKRENHMDQAGEFGEFSDC